jgi:hypothetical protein
MRTVHQSLVQCTGLWLNSQPPAADPIELEDTGEFARICGEEEERCMVVEVCTRVRVCVVSERERRRVQRGE